MAEFELWTKESLVSFAYDAAKRLSEAEEEIKHLQQQLAWAAEDQRTALAAYRSLLRASEGLAKLNGVTH